MIRIIHSELLKLRTTHVWWIFLVASVVFAALTFLINILQVDDQLNPSFAPEPPSERLPESIRAERQRLYDEEMARRAELRTGAKLAEMAANVYTSGQFFGLLLVMLLAILLVTNEFYHQTATATFLATPKRSVVIAGKLITGLLLSVVFWAITTVLVLAMGVAYFGSEGVSTSLERWEVHRALLLNLVAYGIWAIFGIGLGVLMRSQVGATITAAVVYTVGTFAAIMILGLLYNSVLKEDWVMQIAVLVPPLASQHMVSGLNIGVEEIELWPRWTGAIVLIMWAGVAGIIGTLITRKRDIS